MDPTTDAKLSAVTVFADMVVAKPVLLDSQEDGKTRARFKVTQANVVNTNQRLYPNAILTDAVERSMQTVKENRMVGESPHPKWMTAKDGRVVFDTSVSNSVIKWFNQFIDKDGTVYADGEVLDTALGRDLKALIDAEIPVGVSMRALGDSVRKQIGGAMVDVSTRMDIHSYDIVMNPATPGCEVVSVLTDSEISQAMMDDVSITVPLCPTCQQPLTPMDPDDDGDLDFYACQGCKEVFIPEESKTIINTARQELRTLPNDPDWDGWSLARQWKMNQNQQAAATAVATDSKQEGETDMDPKDMLKLLLDSPELQAAIDAKAEEKAKAIAQPALDAVQARKDEEAAAQRKLEVSTFIDSKLGELKDKLAPEVLTIITDSVKGKEIDNKETAELVIDSAVQLYSQVSSTAKLDSFVGANAAGNPAPNTRVEVTNEPKPWTGPVQAMLDSFDRVAMEQGQRHDPYIREVNKPFIEKMINHMEKTIGVKAFADSAAFLDSEIVNTDAVSVTTTQLLNQPTIQQALLIQAFQDVEGLQFVATETFEGAEVRWPVETFVSAATVNPATGLADLLVGEGQGIPESAVDLAWLTYTPQWRRNAISLTTDVIRTLQTGPARYDAVGRGTYHIAFDKRRKVDLAIYLEMIMAADEYQPSVIANETIQAANLSAGAAGTNVAWVGTVTLKGKSASTKNPIVRPRTIKQILPGGTTQQITNNAVSAVVGGTTLTQGYLDAAGNVQGGDYAIDYENGTWYFKASAGLNPAAGTPVLPTVNYSGVTNYVTWNSAVPANTDADKYYNTLLQLITTQRALMGSAPRFQAPNLGIMSHNAAAFIENASMWYKLNDPSIGKLYGLAESTFFGERSGVGFAKINAPWAAGDGRILLTQKGATRYAIETGYQIEGPYPKYDNNGQIIDAKLFYGRENSCLATPQVIDATGAIINPKLRSIKIL